MRLFDCIGDLPLHQCRQIPGIRNKTNESFGICFRDAPISLWKHKQRGWWWFIAHHPVVVFIPALILLNINTLMILMHAGITWWSQGRRWGSGNMVECCQAQAVPPKSWILQCGSRNRQGNYVGNRTSTAQNHKLLGQGWDQMILAVMSLWHNHSMALLSHICPWAPSQPGGCFSSTVSLGSPVLQKKLQQHFMLKDQLCLWAASIPQADPSQHRPVWLQPNHWEGRTSHSESSLNLAH